MNNGPSIYNSSGEVEIKTISLGTIPAVVGTFQNHAGFHYNQKWQNNYYLAFVKDSKSHLITDR